MVSMARAAAAVAVLVVAFAAAATAQESCNTELPGVLVGNYSGLNCQPVWNNFVLRYHQDKNNVLRVVLSTMYSTGWVGMGFSRDGLMVGSSAMVGWIGRKGLPHVKQFALRGKTSGKVVVNRGFLVSNNHDHTVVVQQARIYLAFQLQFSYRLTHQHIILAFGSSIPVNNKLTRHQDKTSFTFDFTTGKAFVDGSFPYGLRRAHGALNLFAWGVLMPIGAILARYFRRMDPLWFYLHVGIQFVAFIIGLAGVVAGVALYNKIQADIPAHRGLGIFILVLGILQILAFFLRPNTDSKYRKYWNWYHHWSGRLVLFFAAVNIVLGIHVGGGDNSWKIGYGFNLAIILLAVIGLEFMLRTRWSRDSEPTPTY
uniref:Cytochrome b561 and DOMON domain-containing protein n=1 Tax=Oryza punctata TaxID=4537 RepID=A0A0E0L5J3_ORYPU